MKIRENKANNQPNTKNFQFFKPFFKVSVPKKKTKKTEGIKFQGHVTQGHGTRSHIDSAPVCHLFPYKYNSHSIFPTNQRGMASTTTTYDFQFYALAASVCFISTLLLRSLKNRHSKSKSALNHPPSPPRLPIIGHIHLLGAVLPKSLQSLASKYGGIMKLAFASQSAIVVSNETFAREMLKNHELSFVSRPSFGASDFNIYEGSEFVNAGNSLK